MSSGLTALWCEVKWGEVVGWKAARAQGLGRQIQLGRLQRAHSTALHDGGANGSPPAPAWAVLGPEEEVTFLPLLPLAIGVDNMHLCVLAGYQCLTLDHSLRDVTLKPESLAALSLPQMIL